MNSPDFGSAGEEFLQLLAIMKRLREPGGCPWDREQTFESIKPYTVEETYEVLDAIDARDWKGLAEELGDFILQAVFYAQMAAESGHFRMEDVLRSINEKLIRRHPHIFGDVQADTASQVLANWEQIKAAEKGEKKTDLLLDGVPRALPALMEAGKISSKAARAGFDWPDISAVFAKLDEEVAELHAASAGGAQEEVEGEVGDILFTVVNIARFLKVDPEQALRKTNGRFRRRFGHVEQRLREGGRALSDATLEEMEALWQQAKAAETQHK